jgi:hypothetical protein
LSEWQNSYELGKDTSLWLKRTVILFYVSTKECLPRGCRKFSRVTEPEPGDMKLIPHALVL